MKTFFVSLIYAAAAGGVSTALVGKPFEKHLRYIASLLCTVLIISPLLHVLPGVTLDAIAPEEPPVSAHTAEELIISQTVKDGSAALENHIFSQTGIKVKSVSIDIESEAEELYFQRIRVKVYREEDVHPVEECLLLVTGGGMETEVSV